MEGKGFAIFEYLRTVAVVGESERLELRKWIKRLTGAGEKGRVGGAGGETMCLFTIHDTGESSVSPSFLHPYSLTARFMRVAAVGVWRGMK